MCSERGRRPERNVGWPDLKSSSRLDRTPDINDLGIAALSEKRIKVTDRRMFTPDGELRDIYKDTVKEDTVKEDAAHESADRAGESSGGASQAARAAASTAAHPTAPAETAPPAAAPAQQPAEPDEPPLESGATFQDLIGLLGQSASVYLAQSAQRLENRGEMLEMARMHVDLLAILKQKTKGNLAADEAALLDDALYQLRMAFVQQG